MRRPIYFFTLIILIALLARLVWWAITPCGPNTRVATAVFKEMTRFDPSEVSEIYFYDASSTNPAWYLRFTYPNDEWLRHFIERFPFTPVDPNSGLHSIIPDWWNWVKVWSLECYVDYDWVKNSNKISVYWVDRRNRRIYLNYYRY